MSYDSRANNFLAEPAFNALKLASSPFPPAALTANDSAPASLSLNQFIGEILDEKYRVEQQLGAGGMGAVYLATHLGTKRRVALKLIMPQFANNMEFVARFRREAEAAGRLNHPNVVNVTDFGFTTFNQENIAYLVMEYLDGISLAVMLAEQPRLPLDLVVDIVEQTALALDKAHKQGIIHRDLKPDNIWLQPDGRGGYHVKILDFGLAKLRDISPINAINSSPIDNNRPGKLIGRQSARAESFEAVTLKQQTREKFTGSVADLNASEIADNDAESNLTRTGTILGTPLYMSPEQCIGKELDARADIYSLGVIVYQMLAGETPFSGNLQTLIVKHKEMPPPLLIEKRRDIPPAIAAQIMSALAKDPEQRPVSASAFATALRVIAEGELPILNQAVSIYRNNFIQYLKLSTRIFLPFLLGNGLTMYLLMLHSQINLPLINMLQLLCWMLPFLSINLAASINTAACALLIEQQRSTGEIDLKLINRELNRSLPKLLLATLQSYKNIAIGLAKFIAPGLRVDREQLLMPPITAIEQLSRSSAVMARSAALVKRLSPLALPLQIRALLVSFTGYALLFIAYFISLPLSRLLTALSLSYYQDLLTLSLLLLIPGIFLILASSFVAIAISLFYRKAREAAGEPLTERTDNGSTLINSRLNRAHNYKYLGKRTLVYGLSLALLVMLSLSSYILFIVPSGPMAATPRAAIVSIPKSENAWREYHLALDILSKGHHDYSHPESISNEQGYVGLYEYAHRVTELNGKINYYLDENAEAVKHLLAGAALPRAQFYQEPSMLNGKRPSYDEVGVLINLLLAQSRRLESQGAIKDSLSLTLAAYKIATDIAEPQTSFYLGVISANQRRHVQRALCYQLNNFELDAESYWEIFNRIAAEDRRMPTPAELRGWDERATSVDVSEMLLAEQADIPAQLSWLKLVRAFPGLRIRTYESFIKRWSEINAIAIPTMKNWDLKNLAVVDNKINAEFQLDHQRPFIGDLLALYLIKDLPVGSANSIKIFYLDRVNSAALQLLAACRAYEKVHGRYPEDLAAAITEMGLTMPIDPATNKPAGYRLADGRPLIWFAGVDGQDDRGENSYDQKNLYHSTTGYDLRYRLNEIPDWFKEQ